MMECEQCGEMKDLDDIHANDEGEICWSCRDANEVQAAKNCGVYGGVFGISEGQV